VGEPVAMKIGQRLGDGRQHGHRLPRTQAAPACHQLRQRTPGGIIQDQPEPGAGTVKAHHGVGLHQVLMVQGGEDPHFPPHFRFRVRFRVAVASPIPVRILRSRAVARREALQGEAAARCLFGDQPDGGVATAPQRTADVVAGNLRPRTAGLLEIFHTQGIVDPGESCRSYPQEVPARGHESLGTQSGPTTGEV
jgi:hypothetical protein